MRSVHLLVTVALALLAVMVGLPSTALLEADGVRRPLGLDLYRPVPDENPLNPAKVDLGRRLFRDKRLSRDGSMACASCHVPDRGFTNGQMVGIGVGGVRGKRNVPTLVNRAWGRSFFWDGRAATLEDQVLQPILHYEELGMTASRVVALANSESYRQRFGAAFRTELAPGEILLTRPGSPTGLTPTLAAGTEVRLKPDPTYIKDPTYVVEHPYDGLKEDDARTLRQVALALASYVRTIQAGDSPFDRYVTGKRGALNVAAHRGLTIFRGKGGCTACHVGPTFSDEDFHNTGVAWQTGVLTDEGRARVTKVVADRGAFKTPTLREVARTAPYMHDGSLATLADVVEFYDRGGAPNPGLDNQLRPLKLSPVEKQDLVAFLRSLTGKSRDGE